MDDGIDTALARLLHEHGVLPLPTLRLHLDSVRAERAKNPDATLALWLRQREVVAGHVIDEALAHLTPKSGQKLPERIGSYQVVRELARGGMGAVYEVQDPGTGVRYALKTLLPQELLESDEGLQRFEKEAQAVARLDHPHIVRVHSAQLTGVQPYIVQDLLPGGTLQDRLRAGPLPAEQAVDVAIKLADAVEHAHERGILHRDIKPLNVLLDDRGEPRLVDFGLARVLDEDRARLTRTGQLLGTPGYLAPEQAEGRSEVDARTDVYGLGATIYALLLGQPPFTAPGLAGLADVVNTPPVSIRTSRPELPPALDQVVLRALAKKPADRFQSAHDLGSALASALTAPAPKVARTRVLAVAAILVVALVTVVLALIPKDDATPETSEPVAETDPPPTDPELAPTSSDPWIAALQQAAEHLEADRPQEAKTTLQAAESARSSEKDPGLQRRVRLLVEERIKACFPEERHPGARVAQELRPQLLTLLEIVHLLRSRPPLSKDLWRQLYQILLKSRFGDVGVSDVRLVLALTHLKPDDPALHGDILGFAELLDRERIRFIPVARRAVALAEKANHPVDLLLAKVSLCHLLSRVREREAIREAYELAEDLVPRLHIAQRIRPQPNCELGRSVLSSWSLHTGRVYEAQGVGRYVINRDPQGALQSFLQASTLLKRASRHHADIALMLIALGRRKEARKAIKRYLLKTNDAYGPRYAQMVELGWQYEVWRMMPPEMNKKLNIMRKHHHRHPTWPLRRAVLELAIAQHAQAAISLRQAVGVLKANELGEQAKQAESLAKRIERDELGMIQVDTGQLLTEVEALNRWALPGPYPD